jgi:pSer/pThr/pTyr-binding forkhead associated (FHA) protein
MDEASRNREIRGSEPSTMANPQEGKIRPAGLLTDRALLVVLSENLFGRSFVLSGARTLIGRSSGCDIVLEDPLVSREHCAIEPDGEGGFRLEDLGSKNATVLNHKVVTRRAPLYYGDRIVIGGTVLRFFLAERVERK